MSRERILCGITGQEFHGTPAEAEAAGWECDVDGWVAPAPGWMRFPRIPRRPISTDRVEYEHGVDFEPVRLDFDPRPLDFGDGR